MFLLFACAPEDADADGFPATEDCADDDPFVYPGAYDAPADGVDADCADGDPAEAWIDSWTLDAAFASYSGVDLFVEGTTSGYLIVRDDVTTELEITATINEIVAGSEIEITIAMAGTWSQTPGDGTFQVYAEGMFGTGSSYEELMHVNWACDVDGDALACDGELKALGGSFNNENDFTR